MGRGTLLAHRNSIYIRTTTPKYVFFDKKKFFFFSNTSVVNAFLSISNIA